MSSAPGTRNSSYPASLAESALEEAAVTVEQVADVKADLTFVGIFSNFIKKMDEAANAAQ